MNIKITVGKEFRDWSLLQVGSFLCVFVRVFSHFRLNESQILITKQRYKKKEVKGKSLLSYRVRAAIRSE